MRPSIKIIPFPEIENGYVVISARRRKDDPDYCKYLLSFAYLTPEAGVEWEPEYGPISVLLPRKQIDEDAREHWYYPYISNGPHFSQLAVDNEGLVQYFIDGKYDEIFRVLKSWWRVES